MIISHNVIPNNIDLKIRNNLLEWVEVMNFLGEYIEQCLTFKNHIDQVCKKISRPVGIPVSVPHNIPRILYFSLI